MKKACVALVFCLSSVVATLAVAQEMLLATSTPDYNNFMLVNNVFGINLSANIKSLLPPAEVATTTTKEEPLNCTRIDISISEQKIRVIEDCKIVYEFLVSTGKHSGATPKGIFRVQNHAPNPISRAYKCHLYRWLAVTPNGKIGIHGLFMSGYEKKLGRPASHGCIRLSRPDAEMVYGWTVQYLKNNKTYPQVYIH